MDNPTTDDTPEKLFILAGRLIFAFQKLEHVLKRLPTLIRQEAWASEFQATLAKRQDTLAKSTLGGVITSLEEAMRPPPPTEQIEEEAASRQDVHIGIHVSLNTIIDDPELVKLRDLAQERNWFVHHSLGGNQPADPASRAALAAKLEALLVRVEERERYFREKEETVRGVTMAFLRMLRENPGLFDHRNFVDEEVAAKLVEIAEKHGDTE